METETLKLTPARKRILNLIITNRDIWVIKTRQERFYFHWMKGKKEMKISATRFSEMLISIFTNVAPLERPGEFHMGFNYFWFQEWLNENNIHWWMSGNKYRINGVNVK